ncbi:MAG: hypothetical protein R6X22_01660 [Gemmatimonadota bacterium]
MDSSRTVLSYGSTQTSKLRLFFARIANWQDAASVSGSMPTRSTGDAGTAGPTGARAASRPLTGRSRLSAKA